MVTVDRGALGVLTTVGAPQPASHEPSSHVAAPEKDSMAEDDVITLGADVSAQGESKRDVVAGDSGLNAGL